MNRLLVLVGVVLSVLAVPAYGQGSDMERELKVEELHVERLWGELAFFVSRACAVYVIDDPQALRKLSRRKAKKWQLTTWRVPEFINSLPFGFGWKPFLGGPPSEFRYRIESYLNQEARYGGGCACLLKGLKAQAPDTVDEFQVWRDKVRRSPVRRYSDIVEACGLECRHALCDKL